MSDSFSLTASAAGIIAPAIQVCQALISYCNSWTSFYGDIGNTSEKLNGLRLTLEVLNDILPKLNSLDASAAPALQNVDERILSCQKGLDQLREALTNFQPVSPSSGSRQSLQNFKQQSLYPFRKDMLQGLRSTVSDMQANLNSAVQVLELYIQTQQETTSAYLETVSADKYTKTQDIQAKLNLVGRDLSVLSKIGIEVNQLPNTIEIALASRLTYHGNQMEQLRKEVQLGVLQHSNEMEQFSRSIANLQFGIIQRPALLRLVIEEMQYLRPHRASQHSIARQCTCLTQRKSKYLRNNNIWRRLTKSAKESLYVIMISSSRSHHHNCPFYSKCAQEKVLSLNLSYCGALLAATVKATLTMTRGAGGFSINPCLSYTRIVPWDAPAFALLEINMDELHSAKEMQACFNRRIRQLSRLYSERKALPRDVYQHGDTVLHKACRIFITGWYIPVSVTNVDLADVYFQFLRRLQELGVSLNTVNAEGRTCLIDLVVLYQGQQSRNYSLVTLLNRKMLDLGAELSPMNGETLSDGWNGWIRPQSLALEFAKCPDLAEAAGCNDVALAVLAESETLLHLSIQRTPHQINEFNVLAQTSLHLSARWPKGIKMLIDAHADVDAFYNYGFLTPIYYAAFWHAHESIRLLLEEDCCRHVEDPRIHTNGTNLLKSVISNHNPPVYHGNTQVSTADASLTVEIIISALAKRRRSLESLAIMHLLLSSIREIGIRPDRVLDSKAGKAIEMLEPKKVPVPPSLRAIEHDEETVYHNFIMNLQQAELLWQSGFRDIDEPDRLGLSPLMRSQRQFIYRDFEQVLESASWLLSKAANRYQLQRYAFRTCGYAYQRGGRAQLTDSSSNIAALHNLGQRLGKSGIYLRGYFSSGLRRNLVRDSTQWSHSFLKDSYSPNIRSVQLLRDILSDPLRDSCQCACAYSGCLPFTQMSKQTRNSINFPFPSEALKAALVDTYCTAFNLDVDNGPELAWVRSEMFRFHTFQKLKLRHTCCIMGLGFTTTDSVFAELGDEEDRQEIRLEQKEQVARLEALIEEFDSKYQAMGIPIIDFLRGVNKE